MLMQERDIRQRIEEIIANLHFRYLWPSAMLLGLIGPIRSLYTRKLLEIKPGEKIIEVGAGNIPFYKTYADRAGKNGLFVAVDIDPTIQDRSRKILYLMSNQDVENTTITHTTADALRLPFPDNSFDVFVAHNMTASAVYYKETFRILKPGGRLLSSFIGNYQMMYQEASYCETIGFTNIHIKRQLASPMAPKINYIEAYKPHRAMNRHS